MKTFFKVSLTLQAYRGAMMGRIELTSQRIVLGVSQARYFNSKVLLLRGFGCEVHRVNTG